MAFKIGKNKGPLQFEEMLDASFLELVRELVSLGTLVSIGASRDLGALSVSVTVDGEYDREWFRTDEDMLEWLKEAVAYVASLEPMPTTTSRKRRRS